MRWFVMALLVQALSVGVFAQKGHPCYASLEQDTLRIGNELIELVYVWNGGHVALVRGSHSGGSVSTAHPEPDLHIPGLARAGTHASLTVSQLSGNSVSSDHLLVTILYYLDSLEVTRHFRIYPAVPVVGSFFEVRGKISPHGRSLSGGERGMLESSQLPPAERSAQLARIPMPGPHWRCKAVRFVEATDHHNTLVFESDFLRYRTPVHMSGNVLMATSATTSWVVLKESPLGDSQTDYTGFDFLVDAQGAGIVNPGLSSSLSRQRTYGYAIGLTAPDEMAMLHALRLYQQQVRSFVPARDAMAMVNTWGDRGRDARISEAFAIHEVERAHRMGLTHVQLDDGWQAGLSRNSASRQGKAWDDWQAEDWKPHPERFPNGLAPVVSRAGELGIQVALWFNPSKTGDYAKWERDAEILIALYREFGIRIFKIDGLELSGKQAEENLRAFCNRVMDGTQGEVVFNFDVTAGHRLGYHYFTEYGNIFLENRYTDWGNYYPHWTLRNLWMLSRYVPPEKLQIEFLNKWRNENKYPADDPFSPARYSFEYLIATTLAAQPLAWMEMAQLPEAAFAASDLLKRYRAHQGALHRGIVLPIGEEPSGRAWTGFQSIGEAGGYFLIYREHNEQATARLRTFLPAGTRVRLTRVAGSGSHQTMRTDQQGQLRFSLPRPASFALYQYQILP